MEFSNVQNLKNATWLGSGTLVNVLGKDQPNDGGGFSAIIDNTGTASDEINDYQIGLSTLRAKRFLNSSIIDLKALGVVYGNVSESQRIENWTILKSAVNFYRFIFISDLIEIHVLSSDSVNLNNDVSLIGSGLNSSEISVFPKLKKDRGDRILFNHTGKDFNIENIKISGYSNRWNYETYDATIKPGGDVDAIQINGSIRIGFWNDLQVNDTLYIQEVNTTQGYTRQVSSFDQSTRTIQFTAGFSTANDFNVSGQTFLARHWNEGSSQSDIDIYSRIWNTLNLEESFFMKSNTVSNESTIQVSNCHFNGLDNNFDFVATNTHLNILNSKIQANSIAIGWTGASTSQFARISCENSIVEDCATLCEASTFENGIISTNARFGGGVYIHPSILPYVRNTYFKDNNSTAWRNFSSSGNIIIKEGWKGVFDGCTWFSDNIEPLLICSSSFPTYINNCEFDAIPDGGNTRLILGNNTFISNCRLNVPINTDSNAEPLNNTDSRYHINISNCVLYENCRMDFAGWPDTRLEKTKVSINNCVWYVGNRNSGFSIKTKADITIRDLKISNRDSTIPNFNDFIVVEEDASFSSIKIDLYNVETEHTFTGAKFITVDGADLSVDSNFVIQLNDCDVSGFPTFSEKITTRSFSPIYV